jgi:hypothetical protein
LPWPLNITWLHMMPMIFWINLPNLTRWRIPSFEQIKSKKIFLAVQVDYRVVFLRAVCPIQSCWGLSLFMKSLWKQQCVTQEVWMLIQIDWNHWGF